MFSSLLRVATRSTASQLDQVAAKSIPPAVAKAQAKAVKEVLDGEIKVDDEVLPIKEGMREESTIPALSKIDILSNNSTGSGISRENHAESSKSAIERKNRQVIPELPRTVESTSSASKPIISTGSSLSEPSPSTIPSSSTPIKANPPSRPIPPPVPPPQSPEIEDQDKEDVSPPSFIADVRPQFYSEHLKSHLQK